MKRRTILAGAAVLAGTAFAPPFPPAANAQGAKEKAAIERPKLVLGVGGLPLLAYLPLVIARERGSFKEEGLTVEINDFGSSERALQALNGGSVDVVAGGYEHTIRMQAKGQDVRAVIELGRYPGIVVGVAKAKAAKYKTFADLKGAKIAVTEAASSTALLVQFTMVKAGLQATDASIISAGTGPAGLAAMKRGEIDVIAHFDPVIAKLEADGDIAVLIDTRTQAGTRVLFGASSPAAVLYMRADFIATNPVTTQRLVNALHKALTWLAKATPDDVANTVPADYHYGDRALYIQAVSRTKESYSRTGVIPADGMTSVFEMLKAVDPGLTGAKVDLAMTFDGRFLAAVK